MNFINNSSKFFLIVFLMMNLPNTYAAKKIQTVDIEVHESAAEAMEATGAEAVETSGAKITCLDEEACNVAFAVSENEMYGGIQQGYVVNSCKVTVYNDGPVEMVNVKTDQPCDPPLPKDHKFSK